MSQSPPSHTFKKWGVPPLSQLKAAFDLAWPVSLAAMITPLLGIIDTAVLTRAGTTTDIAGVALAGAIFSILYWSLGFLRMSLSGLVAQADGANDEAGVRAHLVQGAILGGIIGTILLLLRAPIGDLSTALMGRGTDTSSDALAAMRSYIDIRLLAAPFAIAFFAGVGWLTGQGKMGLMMVVIFIVTVTNAVLDIYFVMVLDMGVEGIALGTAIAEGVGTLLLGATTLFVLHQRGGIRRDWTIARLHEGLGAVLALNADIFIRTFSLAIVFAYFTQAGGKFGDLTVAANQILMHILLTAGLMLDGPA
ncbi:MAG: MATE family efflux transporter, partial [Pseudomonadota bacterium]